MHPPYIHTAWDPFKHLPTRTNPAWDSPVPARRQVHPCNAEDHPSMRPPSMRFCNELSFADSRLKRPSEDSLPFQVKKTRRAWVGWRTLESSTVLHSVKRLSWGQVCAPKGMLSLRSSGDEGAHLQGPADLIAPCQTASAQLPDLIAQGPIFFGKFILVRRLGSPAAQMKDTWQPRAERVGKPAGGGEGAGWRSAGIGEGRRAGGRGLCKGRG